MPKMKYKAPQKNKPRVGGDPRGYSAPIRKKKKRVSSVGRKRRRKVYFA